MSLIKEYVKAVQKEGSYVGGDGCVEHVLWKNITRIEKEARLGFISLPIREEIKITRQDWI